MVPRSLWVPALPFWTVFLAKVNFRREGADLSLWWWMYLQSRVQFGGCSFGAFSTQIVLFGGIPGVLHNAGNGSRMIPGLPSEAKAQGLLHPCISSARSAARSKAECSGGGMVKD